MVWRASGSLTRPFNNFYLLRTAMLTRSCLAKACLTLAPSQSRGVTEMLSYIALGLLARENLFNYLPQLYLLSGMIIKSVSLFHSFSVLFKCMPRGMEDMDSVRVGRIKSSSRPVSSEYCSLGLSQLSVLSYKNGRFLDALPTL